MVSIVGYKLIPAAIDLVKHYESLHDGDLSAIGLQPKLCPAKIWTIGYGHALRDSEGNYLRGAQGKREAYLHYASLTIEQAEALLAADLLEFSHGVERLLTHDALDCEFGAMVSLSYNIGLGAFSESTVLKQFNLGNINAAANAFKLWNKSGGQILNGLVKRRRAEMTLFLNEGV